MCACWTHLTARAALFCLRGGGGGAVRVSIGLRGCPGLYIWASSSLDPLGHGGFRVWGSRFGVMVGFPPLPPLVRAGFTVQGSGLKR